MGVYAIEEDSEFSYPFMMGRPSKKYSTVIFNDEGFVYAERQTEKEKDLSN